MTPVIDADYHPWPRDHFSVSQLSCYLQCPLKYKFKYLVGFEPFFTPGALVFGSAFHSTIEFFFQQWKKGEKVPLETLIGVFRADWQSMKTTKPVLKIPNATEEDLLTKAETMLGVFVENAKPEIVVSTEERFTVDLKNPESGEPLPIPLEGVIDRIEEGETIVEFKTAARSYSQADVDRNLQCTAYAFAWRELHGKMPKKLILECITKAKTPKFGRIETTRTIDDLAWFWTLVMDVLDAIAAGAFPANPSHFCPSCEFAHYCEGYRYGRL
ncbi:MAG: PD-(D/E)XK nuclease family protein [Planctomycetes bacterium]|nr:PD-(D/E)XK nuclease family protein [Planctomycetota bacterium]